MQPLLKQKSAATCETYQRICKVLQRHAARLQRRGLLGDVTDVNLAMALAWHNHRARLSASSARLYRAAALHAIECNPGPRDEEALEILSPEITEEQTLEEHELQQQRRRTLTKLRGAQQRAMFLNEKDWKTLQLGLIESNSEWGQTAATWLTCTLTTGLRPTEWQHARLEGDQLIVENAKSTNGRAHGPTRTLILSNVSPARRNLVQHFLKIAAKHKGRAFVGLYNRVRALIHDVAERCLSKRLRYPCLYTARHMFASCAKSTYSRFEVAALMGHSSIETASRHYAAARYARGGRPLEVQAAPDDVAAVKKLEAARAAQDFLADQEAHK